MGRILFPVDRKRLLFTGVLRLDSYIFIGASLLCMKNNKHSDKCLLFDFLSLVFRFFCLQLDCFDVVTRLQRELGPVS